MTSINELVTWAVSVLVLLVGIAIWGTAWGMGKQKRP